MIVLDGVLSIDDAVRCYGAEILASRNMQRTLAHRQHGRVSVFEHSVNVAGLSLTIARRLGLGVDERAMVRGALLHDYFLYDWHVRGTHPRWHGLRHARVAFENAAREFALGRIERDVIVKHMFPLNVAPPSCRESAVVCMADKLCAIAETFQRGKR